ncbi:acyltransferase family protein [Bradyrhizobium erythrophlei]|uniref:Peptidoglycan/LPS O-acetylase OafA/YrhL, contains acyltransferase and SGNH-hydrolase domains n=1 Tax=Bradyrhizobium erythrophlei TaxID=1437360 RepID=A0A1M7SPZ7_9BRAD|nr:acyltransferase [Bradyrhizobium erythrophlei]SHN60603.1 Peptidoglycan/LPS O-acetylase OafA/YrhL, contains acyltransferase and SGNH-hydrolase domains [Bradyrhizobium erythrophlei]
MITEYPSDKSTIPSLDGLRAVSILIVLVSHAGYGIVVPGGLGVTIFFFLSGYLITTLLMDERKRTGQIHIGKFYLRRIFRLFPPLVVTLVIAYSLVILGRLDGGISWAAILAQLLYFANYYGLFFDSGNTTAAGTGILWSLAVEEHFYMIYPAALTGLLALELSTRRIVLVLAMTCLAVLAWRMYLAGLPNFVTERTYYSSDTRVDSIVFGCILGLAANPRSAKPGMSNPFLEAKPATLLFSAAVVMAVTLAWRDTYFRETFRYSLQGLALMPIFYYAIKCAANFPFTLLNHPWVARIGVYSYAMYLVHYVVINVIEKNAPWLATIKPLLVLVTFAIAAVYAAILDIYVDAYFRRLRKRFR